jgi:catechol 2,3-dioxygenase-like lactoylglutathione lyase family enzyme
MEQLMLNNSKPICFLATKNAEQSREFYEKILGLKFISDDQFALVFDVNGTMLRIQKVENFKPRDFTVLGWNVANIVAETARLSQRGVQFSRYEWMDQDECGIWISPNGARVAWFKDPDGNLLSLTQFG